MVETVRALVAHLRWADRRTIEGYRTLREERHDALRWIAHIGGSQHMWLSRIGGSQPRYAVWPDLDIDACGRLMDENHDALDRLTGAADDAALERVVRYVNTKRETFDSRVGDILTHVAMHAQYHRGQVAAAIRAGGGEPLAGDYIVWRRGNPLG